MPALQRKEGKMGGLALLVLRVIATRQSQTKQAPNSETLTAQHGIRDRNKAVGGAKPLWA